METYAIEFQFRIRRIGYARKGGLGFVARIEDAQWFGEADKAQEWLEARYPRYAARGRIVPVVTATHPPWW